MFTVFFIEKLSVEHTGEKNNNTIKCCRCKEVNLGWRTRQGRKKI